MKTINLHQVDAFTTTLFGGNPAGVVSDAEGLSEVTMQNVACEMALSETAFVLPPTTEGADVQLRFFTRNGSEVDFCGHATMAALFQLAQLQRYDLGKPGKNQIGVQTKAGTLPMTVANNNGTLIGFTAPPVTLQAYRLQGKDFTEAFGLPADALRENGTILIDHTLNYIYIPVPTLAKLTELTFDFNYIREQFQQESIVVFCLFTNETIQSNSDLHARGLAPLVGIDEDPFTGSMQAGLVHAAKQNNMIAAAQQTIVVEQGYKLNRPGSAIIEHKPATNEIRVQAQAVAVFSAQMEV